MSWSKTRSRERYSIEEIAEKFRDKISTEEYVRFRHPSYSEALPFLLDRKCATAAERQEPDNVIDGFLKVLCKLVDSERAQFSVAATIAVIYDKLPQGVANELLIKLADTKSYLVANFLGKIMIDNYDKLPQGVANQLLTKLEDNRGARQALLYIAKNKLPLNV